VTRLFVAIELPPALTSELARLQPSPLDGIKLTSMAQMHLTLHFIGDAPIAPAIAMLQLIRARPFTLRVSGLGQFRSKNGGVTLWAGVNDTEALMELHAAVGIALAAAGVALELHSYRPHITLAKWSSDVPASCIAQCIERGVGLILPEIAVEGFALYSSTTNNEGAQYQIEQRFPLPGHEA
jgi:RNA 2',3'-cyclic 3'-phosphodiesterase